MAVKERRRTNLEKTRIKDLKKTIRNFIRPDARTDEEEYLLKNMEAELALLEGDKEFRQELREHRGRRGRTVETHFILYLVQKLIGPGGMTVNHAAELLAVVLPQDAHSLLGTDPPKSKEERDVLADRIRAHWKEFQKQED